MPAGSDPSELRDVPSIVEIPDSETGATTRRVRILFLRPDSPDPALPLTTFVAVKPPRTSEILWTVIWFLGQLAILLIGMTGYWQRPTDPMTRAFCMMCTVTMVAFIGGFHWAIVAQTPLLNIPFILCATALPAVTLHFFSSFPRGSGILRHGRVSGLVGVYLPMSRWG